jgi:hypothetical protein
VGGTCTLNNETGHVQVKNIQIKEPMWYFMNFLRLQ